MTKPYFLLSKIMSMVLVLLGLLVPLLFLVNLTKNPFYIQIILAQTGVAILLIMYTLYLVKSHEIVLPKTCLDFPLVMFFAAGILSFLVGLFIYQKQYKAVLIVGVDNILFFILNGVAIFYLVVFLTRGQKLFNLLIGASFVVGFLASLYGILQYFGKEFIWSQTVNYFGNRCTSTFGNPNFLASFLVLILPLNLIKLVLAKNKLLKIIYGILFLFLSAALFCTLTRSAWLGFGASLIFILIFFYRRIDQRNIKRLGTILAGGILICFIVVFLFSPAQILDRFSPGTALWQRMLIWRCAWDMFLANPLTGQGWGTFELFYPLYQGKYLKIPFYAPLRTHANHAHNELLHILSETGIVGLAISVWLVIAFIKYFRNLLKKENSFYWQAQIVGLVAGLFAFSIDNLLNVTFHIAAPVFFAWIFLGLLMSIENITSNKTALTYDVGINRFFFKISCLVAIIFLVGIVKVNTDRFQAALNSFQAQQRIYRYDVMTGKDEQTQKTRYKFLTAGIAKLEQTAMQNPWDVDSLYELGNAYFRQGNILAAQNMYLNALEINFGYDEIFYNLGITYQNQKQWDKAGWAFTQSYKINPTNAETKACLIEISRYLPR